MPQVFFFQVYLWADGGSWYLFHSSVGNVENQLRGDYPKQRASSGHARDWSAKPGTGLAIDDTTLLGPIEKLAHVSLGQDSLCKTFHADSQNSP